MINVQNFVSASFSEIAPALSYRPSLEQLKTGLACKLNSVLHVVSGYFSV